MAITGEAVDRNEVLTFDGQPSDGEKVLVGGRWYVFKKIVRPDPDLLPDVANDVAIGGDLATTIANLQAAISGDDAGKGNRYARSTLAHPRLGRRKVVATATTLIFGPDADHAEDTQRKKEAAAEKEAKAVAKEAKAEAKAEADAAKAKAEAENAPQAPSPEGPNPSGLQDPAPSPEGPAPSRTGG